MSAKDLKCNSHKTPDPKVWWYEDIQGIDVIVHPHANCASVKISWLALRAALGRKDRKP